MTLSILSLFLAALAGGALGAVYLCLLWVAVRSLPQDRGGVLVFISLGLARLALLLGALAAAAALGLRIEGIAVAVAGFIAMRLAATRWLGTPTPGGAPWK
ncbi:ATP synthase subunit I [Lutimaribacter saemankumensis]|uniref:F1/F0 ATPase, subunit 2 n=1 Tax=Lutimaribacter saemankumensis TaxID=490829 RepID=A0A1G8T9V6_9RHOB|nr:ATP synthase subunit I [Lutimaribacter saemankumensis]SDJ38346.1 F1/F0 ATPase, subunit 2 [Lutimaribacter saemankumensis]